MYNKYFNEFFPVLIISNNTQSEKKDCLNKVYNGTSKIIVCVDMFREGIDIPQLKICAIHDKYKSLPITIQFIGRFARAKVVLCAKTVVAVILTASAAAARRENIFFIFIYSTTISSSLELCLGCAL